MADEENKDEQNELEELEGEEQSEGAQDKEKSLEDKLKEVIGVDVAELAPLRRKMTISVPRDTLDNQVQEQYDELRREAMVPGFRKGRAPRRLLEKRFGSEVNETLVQQLVSTGYMAAVDKSGLKVLGDPLIFVKGDGEGEVLEEVQAAIAKMKMPPEGPLVFSCEVEIRPEFEMPSLDGMPLEKPIVTIADADIDAQVKRLLGMQGTFEPVNEGGIQPDDLVTADLKMTSEGTLIKEQPGIKLAARPQVVDGVVVDKLGEKLTGAKAGDTVSVEGPIPDDYAQAELRGKTATFEFVVKDIQRLKLPELNEAFLKAFGFESEQDLRDYIRQDLEANLGEEIKRALRSQVSEYLLEKSSFELPERLSNKQINQVTMSRILEMYRRGIPPAEAEKNIDELKTSSREDAIRDLKLAFIMEKLAETVEVEVSEGEINTMIAAIALREGERFDRVRDQLAKQGGLTSLYVQIRDDKILDELVGKATVTETKLEEMKARKKSGKKKSEEKAADSTEAAGEGEEPPKPRENVKRTPPKKGKKDENFADET